jgi:hypothetical protein
MASLPPLRAAPLTWLGLFVVLLLAILVVFVVIHDAEHVLEDAAAVCLALAMIFSTL